MATEQNSPTHAGWEASLRLELARIGSRTVVARRSSVGPLVVQRPFYPEGDVCHVYVVHPPGGVVGGDRLALNIHAREGTHSLITTPAATKFYRSDGRVAQQRQEIVAESAVVEWLPQETIVFPDAQASIATCAHLNERSRFIGWEITCYGRPASGMTLASGRVAQDFELWVNDTPLVLDHLRLDGASEIMHSAYGLGGKPVLGTLFAYPAEEAVLTAARAAVGSDVAIEVASAREAPPAAPTAMACTLADGVLVCRAVGAQADAVRASFIAIWSAIRPAVTGRPAVPPRIWAT